MSTTEQPVREAERAGRRSEHPSSADAWEARDRALAVTTPADAVLRRDQPVEPLVVAERAKMMEAAFQALCDAVLDDNDYAWYRVEKQVHKDGRLSNVSTIERRKRKSAWRKLGRYFNVDVVLEREVIGHRHNEQSCSRIVLARNGTQIREDEDCSCPTVYARYHGKVIAPNGRVGFGVGVCSINERGFSAQDHSIPATAYSRMVSRAVSDMIGAGESSVEDPTTTRDASPGERATPVREPFGEALTAEQVSTYAEAYKAASEDKRRRLLRWLKDEGYVKGAFLEHGADDFDEAMLILGSDAVPGLDGAK